VTAYQLSERAFQDQVIQLAKLTGWAVFHPYLSARSEPGWPDLVLCRGERILFRELKSERGAATQAQLAWIMRLRDAGQDADIWRPSMWDTIKDTLSRAGIPV
jgi:hypothetical protein